MQLAVRGRCNGVHGNKYPVYFRTFSYNTFSSLSTKVRIKNKKGKIAALRNSKKTFPKMLFIAKTREFDMTPFPSPIATIEVKTVKAKLLNAFEVDDPYLYSERTVGVSALIIQAMPVLQATTVSLS